MASCSSICLENPMGKGFWRALREPGGLQSLGHKELQTTKQLSTRRDFKWNTGWKTSLCKGEWGYCYLFSYAHWLIGFQSEEFPWGPDGFDIPLASSSSSTCHVLALPCPPDFNPALHISLVFVNTPFLPHSLVHVGAGPQWQSVRWWG